MSLPSYDCFIDGQWRPAHSRETLEILDPADGAVLARIARGGASDIDEAVRAAQAALPGWADCVPVQRGRVLHAIARRILEEQDRLARIESQDTGKPLAQAQADAVAAARFFEYYAGVADKVLGSSIPLGPDYADFTVREPLGVTAQIVPWNYPLQIASRGLAPALATGNTVVLKPAELACLSVLELTRICHEEGLPPGVLNVVPGLGQEAGYALAAHPGVNLVVFTGSVATGAQVMRTAADNIVPVLLELGGKSPNIVLADADLDDALPVLLKAAFPNSGQTCSAGSRVLVQRARHRELVDRLAALCRGLKVGPGLQNPDIGPLVSRAQQGKVLDYIGIAGDEGAEVITGGTPLPGADLGRGNFVSPTLLDGARPEMRVHREEIFGPVLTILPFDEVEEAAALANATDYGLVAGIWGRDVGATNWLARTVKAGQIFINCYGAGGGVELPFGGYRKSGFGREKGLDALLSYTQVKNICTRIALPRRS
ncbi:aldehyde dehydrogenase family protein (plasmid) [Azospirillum argentinense]|uniref:Aldehyde dehydrogenase family protein n=1 Tax=Azospirillum argentinense TaxID=2970906 RepID=A0A4D8PM93_9PROT|nr:aldehyde dehydrogenase family protein [Azospirillum argentinense]QCN98364.1 aldehyde dehydrogenase family protein [Azospirillum argentinense]